MQKPIPSRRKALSPLLLLLLLLPCKQVKTNQKKKQNVETTIL
jgi:hypothetical protein